MSIEGQSWSEFLLTSLKPLVTMEAKQSLCSAVEPDSFNKVKMFVGLPTFEHCSDFSGIVFLGNCINVLYLAIVLSEAVLVPNLQLIKIFQNIRLGNPASS